MPFNTMPPQTAATLSKRAIYDLAYAVSKLASGWLKTKMDADPNWVAGSFRLDLAAAFDNDIELKVGDYMRIAEKAQQLLHVHVPKLHGKAPGVAVDHEHGRRTLYISFLDTSSPQG